MKNNNIKKRLKCKSSIQCTQRKIKPAQERTKVLKENKMGCSAQSRQKQMKPAESRTKEE